MRVKTIKDIANEAGVSVTTVSKILNNKDLDISPATRERVLAIIKEFNYTPNAAARSLVTKKNRLLGLLIPDISNEYFADMARGVEDAAHLLGYNVIFCNTDDDPDKEKDYLNILLEKTVEGILIIPVVYEQDPDVFAKLAASRVRMIVLDRVSDAIPESVPQVFFDNVQGGYLATKYLLDKGHRRIGCIRGPLDNKSAEDRLAGYRRALEEQGVAFDPDIVAEGNYRLKSGVAAAKELLAKDVRAVFVQNDSMAFGAYQAIHAAGKSIPDDVSLVGYDDIGASEVLTPPLTTVRQPCVEMGKISCAMLVAAIEKKPAAEMRHKFEPEIVERESVATPRL